jgi:hypothetical protein
LPFQELRAINRENTHSLITSPLTQIEYKSFPGIVERYLLVFVDVAFYRIGSIPPYSRMLYPPIVQSINLGAWSKTNVLFDYVSSKINLHFGIGA